MFLSIHIKARCCEAGAALCSQALEPLDGRLYKLKQLLEEDLKRHWTVHEMAATVNLSAPHLHKLFKAEIGMAPLKFLNELRLERARDLLESTFLQIKEIRCRTFLTDRKHFAQEFKRKFGMTRSEFRKAYWDRIQLEELKPQTILQASK